VLSRKWLSSSGLWEECERKDNGAGPRSAPGLYYPECQPDL
jgi:hypothetical protein